MNYMKRLLSLSILLLMLHAVDGKAATGCNTGNVIYPNATGGHNSYGDPTYYSTSPITIRWWDGDPNCGIRDNKIKIRTSGDDNCQVIGGPNVGVLYTYNPADNNCLPLPLDDYIPILIVLTALVGGYFIRNRFFLQKA